MYRKSIQDITKLVTSFLGNYGDNLLHYLSLPRIAVNGVAEKCMKAFQSRTPFEDCSIGFAGPDSKIFKKRFRLLNHNNRAFFLASKKNPSIPEIEEFSLIEPCWAILFSVKKYLHDHSELAVAYRGLLPFGKPVTAFYNSLNYFELIKGSPTFSDHINLQTISNKLADLYGCSSVIINDEMYLEGNRILNKG